MKRIRMNAVLPLSIVVAFLLCGCASPQGGTPTEKRADVQQMRREALATFYANVPQMRDQLANAPGFGAFSGVSTQTIFVSSGNGFGVIRDNATGQDTYMRAVKLGGGLGAGVQGVEAIVVFHDAKTMRDMLAHGWGVTGKAEAAAKVDTAGGATAAVITLPGMSIYRFTKSGVMLGGALEGVKIWPDQELN